MSDFARLRDTLTAALFLAACGGSPPPRTEPPIGSALPPQPDAAVATATPTPIDAPVADPDIGGTPDQDPYPPGPSCPSGDWCSTAALTKPLARKEAKDVLGCKSELYDYDDKNKAKKTPKSWPGQGIEMTIDEPKTKEARAKGDKTTCCYTSVEPCPGGRALIVDGEAIVAPVRTIGEPIVTDDELREALAIAWIADARTEHASIASFARAALEMMAVGAPRSLLDDVAVAMRDEIRHAELCFALAARYAGTTFEPGVLPAIAPRAADLVRFACDTFVEGCVGETVAVLAATRAMSACRDEHVAATLAQIIDDETRHAALAWRTLAWAIAAGGDDVKRAVRALAITPVRDAGAPVDDRLAAHGRLDGATSARAEADAWREIILPTLATLTA